MIASCTPLQPTLHLGPNPKNQPQSQQIRRKSRKCWKSTEITDRLPHMATAEAEITSPQETEVVITPPPAPSRQPTSERAILQARAYADYSAERKAEILALVTAHGGNVAQVARLTQIPHQTIRRWVEASDRYSALQTEKQIDLAQKLENNAHKLANSIADHDLSIVPLASKATALGIMVDKMQLLRGEPTSITANVERQELTVTLRSALSELTEDAIDVTPEG